MGLPEAFLSGGDGGGGGGGGGVIQGSASEGTMVAVLAARARALKHMRRESPAGVSDCELLAKMTLYTSDQVGVPEGICEFVGTIVSGLCNPHTGVQYLEGIPPGDPVLLHAHCTWFDRRNRRNHNAADRPSSRPPHHSPLLPMLFSPPPETRHIPPCRRRRTWRASGPTCG